MRPTGSPAEFERRRLWALELLTTVECRTTLTTSDGYCTTGGFCGRRHGMRSRAMRSKSAAGYAKAGRG